MFTLIKNNVVKIVDSEEKAEKLKANGFTFQQPDLEGEDDRDPFDLFCCPHCSREYKTERGLFDHIAKEHQSNGGDGNGGANTADNGGSSGTPQAD